MGICPSLDPELRVLQSHNVFFCWEKAISQISVIGIVERFANIQLLHTGIERHIKPADAVHV